MAISVGGTVVIDDGRNVININDLKVGVVTITGSTGDITTPGTVTAGAITGLPDSPIYFNPPDGSTDQPVTTDIIVTFTQNVAVTTTGIGTTANITLRSGAPDGSILETIGVASTGITVSGAVVTINPVNALPYSTNVYVVIDANAFGNSGGKTPLIENYNFTTVAPGIGDPFEGGYLVCESGGIRWIVATIDTEVSRDWYNRNDANTTAQSATGCVGWFVPDCASLLNPGYSRNQFWDSYSVARYWSSTEVNADNARQVNIDNGITYAVPSNKTAITCVRSFRCTTY